MSGPGTQLAKGRIVLPSTRSLHTFMFNPTEVKTRRGWKWGRHSIFGHSHNVLSGGSGDDEPIEFSLIVDGERGRMGQRRASASGGTGRSPNDVSFDISAELNFYRSLTFPVRSTPTEAGAYTTGSVPPTFVLSLGPMFTRVNAVMEHVEIQVVSFTPRLEPIRAKVDVKMLVSVMSVIYANEVFAAADPDGMNDLNYAIATGEVLE